MSTGKEQPAKAGGSGSSHVPHASSVRAIEAIEAIGAPGTRVKVWPGVAGEQPLECGRLTAPSVVLEC